VGSIYADPQRTYAESRAAALTTALAGDALDIMEGESPAEYADRVGREALQHDAAAIAFAQAAPNAPYARSANGGVTVPTTAVTPEQAQQIRSRISAAEGDANQLASIRQSLTLRGINPADYGL
jgi:hypothetical protein